jgi:hypothetical protein
MDQKKGRTGAQALAVFGMAAGLTFLTGFGPARAADDSESNSDSFYEKTFGKVMATFGLKKSDGSDQINYRERPPLVLPSGRDLPPPEKADAVVASPAWPKDPDVKRRKLEAERKKQGPDTETQRRQWEDPKLMNEQAMTPGPRPRGVQSVNTGPGRSGATDFGEIYSPSQLGYKGGILGKMFYGKDEDTAQFTGEPPRTELTEPPPGYQTPSPDQPYGVGQAAPKADVDYLNRAEPKR